jgi:hypothetical protein
MRFRSTLLLSVLLTGVSSMACAGPYADDLSKCLVSSTTKADRVELVRWMFAAMGSHPAVKTMATVTPEQLDKANQSIATLITQLLTKTCADQAQKAVQYEGPATVQMSFQLLGQVAATELFADPAVMNAMKGLSKYVDEKQLTAALQPKPSPSSDSKP